MEIINKVFNAIYGYIYASLIIAPIVIPILLIKFRKKLNIISIVVLIFISVLSLLVYCDIVNESSDINEFFMYLGIFLATTLFLLLSLSPVILLVVAVVVIKRNIVKNKVKAIVVFSIIEIIIVSIEIIVFTFGNIYCLDQLW